MRLIIRNGIYFLLLTCFAGMQINAQSILNKLEFGLHAGSFIYQGDLTPSKLGSFRTPGWQIALSASTPLNHFLSARANLSFGKLRGDDAKYSSPEWRQHRNFNFRSSVAELSGQLVWDILSNHRKTGISPYLFAGIGYAFLNIKRDASNLDPNFFSPESVLQAGLNADLAHTPPRGLLVFPVGAGLRYPLTNKISLNTETSYRLSFTDYLDGFSQSGNPAQKDHYLSMSVGIFYRFNQSGTVKCPVVRD